MDSQRLAERIADYTRAVVRLREALARPKDEFLRDSVIQRFEFSYELAWKLLKLRLEAEGINAATPRQAIQEALQAGFIEDGNLWSDMLRQRNLTSHTYDESLADSVYDWIAASGISAFELLAQTAATWSTT